MQFRLSFDDRICSALIEKIKARSNGGSLNKTLQTMVIEWYARDNDGNLSKTCQKPVKSVSKQGDQGDLENQLSAAFEAINDEF